MPQLRLGAQAAGAGQPAPGFGGVSEVVGRYAIDDRGAVEERQQELLVRGRVRYLSPLTLLTHLTGYKNA
jgi:hypothetical protein